MKYLNKKIRSIRRRLKKVLDYKRECLIQDSYDLTELRNTKKLSIFLIPKENSISGGIMSIFNICSFSREIDSKMVSILVTYPGSTTYSKNTNFDNDEKIYRFSQVIDNANNIEELFIHLPEVYASKFYSKLTKKQILRLKSVSKVRINILNQNIDLMPSYTSIENLFNITSDVIHSVGFKNFNTQSVCNKYKIPLFYLKSYLDLGKGIKKSFEEKKKRIFYSNDYHPMKKRILTMIQNSLPDFKLECIENVSYSDFLKEISEAAFCLTFGEGFDGYYIQPYYAGSIGITVYNHEFFPNKDIKSLPFVYRSYSELHNRVVEDIKKAFSDKNEYESISNVTLQNLERVIERNDFIKKELKNIYEYGPPYFIPKVEVKNRDFSNKESILTAIIFTYNHGDSISKCIESVVNQKTSYKYEIHIWDDASIDNTSQICLEYAKAYPDKIDLIIQDENTFLNSYDKIQSYHAIKKVNTKYFCIIDGDDMWLDENKIQIAIDFLESNSEYVGFGHDTMERNVLSNVSRSYIHDSLKANFNNPIRLGDKSPFILTSSRIFRNIGYGNIGVLPIDYLLYYYHLAHGPIYFYDKIMGLYNIGKSSTFANSSSRVIKDANCMFAFKLAKLFDHKQDKFCTDLLKSFVEFHYKSNIRYNLLFFFKKIFGVKRGWEIWFSILFVKRYGKSSRDIHYIYSHYEAKMRSDSRVKKEYGLL